MERVVGTHEVGDLIQGAWTLSIGEFQRRQTLRACHYTIVNLVLPRDLVMVLFTSGTGMRYCIPLLSFRFRAAVANAEARASPRCRKGKEIGGLAH